MRCLEGRKRNQRKMKVFAIEVSDMHRIYSRSFEDLSEQKLCGLIPKINDKKILTDLKKRKITLSDSVCDATEIDLLIGADVMGKLLTENIVELDSGLTAVESLLGWTVIGKQNFRVKDNFMTTVSMHVGRIPLHELWKLEVLVISDPTGTDKIENDLSDYKEKIKILPSGGYEVELPWKYDSIN
ncbi:DUF1758 domain-containing protein [Nephila pilipes]|uniref:DUF1758 domain-containing protein n=1 Tax=Nephila pilipes TaxID=299642 RepID=A0A8X6U8C8_NEPPI|nr:DUF1758 domain-containing protein [Nephila pilipes]